MSDTFKIVFDGKIAEGQDLAAVQGGLLKLYKGNQLAVQRLFTGETVVVKDKLDQQTAMKYKAVFGQAGAIVRIIPETETTQLTMERPVPPEKAPPPVNKAIGNTKSFPNHSSQPDNPKAQPGSWLNAAAVIIVLAIFACLGLRFWASNELDSFISIDHVAANKNKVVIHAAGKLYLQSHSGNLEQQIDLTELGINGPLADLEILDDGSLLIGDMGMKTILRCNPQSKTCEPFAPTGDFTLEENFKFLVDQPRQQLYIADTNNHRLIIQNLADSTCLLARTDSQLSYPNDMARDAGDMLYLCDTNKFRVIPLKVGKDSVKETGGPLASIPFLSADPGDLKKLMNDPEKMKAESQKAKADFGQMMDDTRHAKPFALATGPDNNLWIAQLNTIMTNGTINILSPTGERVGEVTLDKGAVPVDIIKLNNDFLVADAGLVRAYTIDPETHDKKDFGDDSFKKHLADIYSQRSVLERYKSWGLIGVIIFAIGAFAVMIVAKRQRNGLLSEESTSPQKAVERKHPSMVGDEAPRQKMELKFGGSAKEYFRIWIVNLCLTLLTFGIFSAWAKVRKKRYIYSHLTIDGTPFQYLAQPLPILKGRLIAVTIFLIYYLTSNFFTAQLPYVLLAGLVIAPWVMVQSVAFNARYSAFRNMSFNFDGAYPDALKVIIAWGIIPALVIGAIFDWWGKPWVALVLFGFLGLLFPWWMQRLKDFIISRTSFGGINGKFSATGSDFFKIYFRSGLIIFGVSMIAGLLAAIFGFALGGKNLKLMTITAMVPIYAAYIVAYAFVQANLTNTVWNNIRLGPVNFNSSLKAVDLIKLYFTNALGIVFSVGLLIPWAVMRTVRYRADCTRVISSQGLSQFQGSSVASVKATGSELSDFFDMDLSI